MTAAKPSQVTLNHELEAERKGFRLILGIDEAGRGPLAGPVVAAAVALKSSQFSIPVDDSKKLTPQKRESLFQEILAQAYVGVGVMNENVIDEYNILRATFMAMETAVYQLLSKLPPDDFKAEDFSKQICLLIDGNQFKTELPYVYETIVAGDSLSLSIACASIIAKVTRDRILKVYDRIFPQYGFAQHKGYGTLQHRQAIQRHGLSSIHRRSFVENFLATA